MDKEVQTDDLVKKIFDDGKACFVPRFAKNDMSMVKLKDYQDFLNLPRNNKYGIRQPDSNEKRDEAFDTGGLDLILTPGVAFTKYGCRLGHGKGYYDGYLTKYTHKFLHQRPYVLGLAFKEQILDFVPTGDNDFLLDEVTSN
uniref:5-formyltetrahydrofolate cyclo-ligase n=1 Tax=Romanomermis culicivorax TaxID=13658 RepID=A0A915HKR1_ROMCU